MKVPPSHTLTSGPGETLQVEAGDGVVATANLLGLVEGFSPLHGAAFDLFESLVGLGRTHRATVERGSGRR